MEDFGGIAAVPAPDRRLAWLGLVLLVIGFLGHFFAARAIGGSYLAFRDHIFGFFALA